MSSRASGTKEGPSTYPQRGPEKLGECRCKPPKRLVLCFDGTGNEFKADETDSNIVKIYELLNREAPNQYNHYQRRFIIFCSNRKKITMLGVSYYIRVPLDLNG